MKMTKTLRNARARSLALICPDASRVDVRGTKTMSDQKTVAPDTFIIGAGQIGIAAAARLLARGLEPLARKATEIPPCERSST